MQSLWWIPSLHSRNNSVSAPLLPVKKNERTKQQQNASSETMSLTEEPSLLCLFCQTNCSLQIKWLLNQQFPGSVHKTRSNSWVIALNSVEGKEEQGVMPRAGRVAFSLPGARMALDEEKVEFSVLELTMHRENIPVAEYSCCRIFLFPSQLPFSFSITSANFLTVKRRQKIKQNQGGLFCYVQQMKEYQEYLQRNIFWSNRTFGF